MTGVKVQGVNGRLRNCRKSFESMIGERGTCRSISLYFVPVSVIQNSSDATNAFRPQTQLNQRFDEVMVETLGAP